MAAAPLKPIYEIGSPLFRRVVIHLDKKYYPGREFVIEDEKQLTRECLHSIRHVSTANRCNKPWIYHSDVVKGGTLVLVMGPQPNKKWGSALEAAPPQDEN